MALLHEPTRKGGAPLGGDSDDNTCAETKAMPINEIPPTPLYKTDRVPHFLLDTGGEDMSRIHAQIPILLPLDGKG